MTFILKGIDELQQQLDDHVAITQQLAFSAFKKPFSDRIDGCDTCCVACTLIALSSARAAPSVGSVLSFGWDDAWLWQVVVIITGFGWVTLVWQVG